MGTHRETVDDIVLVDKATVSIDNGCLGETSGCRSEGDARIGTLNKVILRVEDLEREGCRLTSLTWVDNLIDDNVDERS